MQPLDWPPDINLRRYTNYLVDTEEIVVHALRSFASQFAQGIIYFMNSLGTEDEVDHPSYKSTCIWLNVCMVIDESQMILRSSDPCTVWSLYYHN